jgi:hypothetical protein
MICLELCIEDGTICLTFCKVLKVSNFVLQVARFISNLVYILSTPRRYIVEIVFCCI